MDKSNFSKILIAALLSLSACATAPVGPAAAPTAPAASTSSPAAPLPSVTAPPSDASAAPTATAIAIGDSAATAPAPIETQPAKAQPKPKVGQLIEVFPGQVEGLDVQVLESQPVQVKATLNGTLGDGCTTLNDITQVRTDNVFVLEVTVKRPKDAMCTMIAKLYSKSVSLDIAGLKAGTYIVFAGTLSQTFTLAADY